MVDREAEVTVVETVAIPMGTMIIKAATQANIQVFKTILHFTPTGMIIQGLRSKSKLRIVLVFKTSLGVSSLAFCSPHISSVLDFLTCVEIQWEQRFFWRQ